MPSWMQHFIVFCHVMQCTSCLSEKGDIDSIRRVGVGVGVVDSQTVEDQRVDADANKTRRPERKTGDTSRHDRC